MSELPAWFLYECTLPTASSTWSFLIKVLDRRMFHVKQIPFARCRARYRSRPLLQTKSSCFRITGQRRPSIVQLIGWMSRACFLSISHAHSYSLHLPMFHVKHCFSAPLAINVSRETFIVKWANSGKRSVPHSRMFHVKHKGRTRVDRNTGRRSNLVIRTYPDFLPIIRRTKSSNFNLPKVHSKESYFSTPTLPLTQIKETFSRFT